MKGDKIYFYDRCAFYVFNRAFHKQNGVTLSDYSCQVGIFPDKDIVTDFVSLSKDGVMTIRRSYGWDGASGPTFDTPSTMRTSLIHDGTFQLFRLKLLDLKWFAKANDNLREMALEDGMWRWRANLWHSHVVQYAMERAVTNWKIEKEKVAP